MSITILSFSTKDASNGFISCLEAGGRVALLLAALKIDFCCELTEQLPQPSHARHKGHGLLTSNQIHRPFKQ